MKTVILYVSTHHHNTQKVVESMAQCVDAHTIDLLKNPSPDISSYEAVGLASGVYLALCISIYRSLPNKPHLAKTRRYSL